MQYVKLGLVALVVSLVVVAINNRFEIPLIAPKAGPGTLTRAAA